ncbi:beta/gamma crystallin-related protein [Niveispirillum sp. KHB5.9]|uniref:beta/gamma crystallin-related protein n=1 Tax=Niveispirillum sp. KHB5.9 TaxID=3400269 RepID=UPI003A84971D
MKRWKAALAAMLVMGSAGAAHAGSVTLFSETHFRGDRITIRDDINHLDKLPPWDDRARSLVVNSGTWEICKDKKYDHCRTLTAGARVSDVAEVKNLRGGITSLREIGRDDRDRGRDRDRDQWGWNPGPPPPPQRYDDGIVWNGGGGGSSYGYDQRVTDRPQNSCQSQVERAFIDRYGYRGRSRFAGDSVEGTIWWENEPWQYRCAGGRTNIWR